ncbi:DICT sensory domain-containing protein [Natronolimnohabitans innermongolicus]|uniref:Putative sensor protein n=1 Tax=Natronolimnohabitans innermongolicus JCM 12255 TaxID=1227499 RepID=L9WR66_9EURY|nr:DICT sensory domain-containing protein [Natronolimnohabitans innermongolicus]ELY51696.1 putative sensor protein [Natronolimnohabitans innermongolicus JCM 12255]
MPLRSFIDDVDGPERTIAVVSDDEPGPLAAMLEAAFETQSVNVRTDGETIVGSGPLADLEGETDGDVAVLLEDGEPVAASPMTALYESLLAINSDLFVTGARGLGEIDLPDVIAGVAEAPLRLRGYPLAHKEKLLLILLSRHIEQRAWEAGDGTLRSSFQRLSRIEDEVGTREVYEGLAATDVDVHVYGVDDGTTVDVEATVHTGTDSTYRNGWFVVYRPDGAADDSGPDAGSAALVCLETASRIWEGVWTRNSERVAEIDDAIAREL